MNLRLPINRSFPLLCTLLLLTACSGSRLGERVGQSLEADPQLTEENAAAATPSEAVEPVRAVEDIAQTEDEPAEVEETVAAAPTEPQVEAGGYTDLAKAPEEVQEYLVDMLELDLLEVRSTPAPAEAPAEATDEADDEEADSEPTPPADIPGPGEFRPNRAVTRREYARWLLATNNRYYDGERDRKIRPGVTSSRPVFRDVGVDDPDFAAIQGLAEAGIIPSPLTGSSTSVNFRPNAPLNREDLLLWKVPLDTRQTLPQATSESVAEAWGFQDASNIEPRPLQAVLADYQNGEFSNIRRAFGYTTLFQPDKAATRAETAAVLWRIGNSTEAITAAEIRNPRSARDSEDD